MPQGERLRNEFADDDSEVGQRNHDNADGKRVGGALAHAQLFEQGTELFFGARSTDGSRKGGDEGNTDLHDGQCALRPLSQSKQDLRFFLSLPGQLPEAGPVHGDEGHFRAGDESVREQTYGDNRHFNHRDLNLLLVRSFLECRTRKTARRLVETFLRRKTQPSSPLSCTNARLTRSKAATR